jgi:flavodoxin
MRIDIYHASKYGNGAKVADELGKLMAAEGNEVSVHHIDELGPRDVPPADLYVFGSPTHFGKAPGNIMRFLRKANLPSGARYAVFATCSATVPDKRTGRMPTEEEMKKLRRAIPMMDEQLKAKGLVKVAETLLFVRPDTMKGPLVDGWQEKVEEFARLIGSGDQNIGSA